MFIKLHIYNISLRKPNLPHNIVALKLNFKIYKKPPLRNP